VSCIKTLLTGMARELSNKDVQLHFWNAVRLVGLAVGIYR
jgi:hypothetical protein